MLQSVMIRKVLFWLPNGIVTRTVGQFIILTKFYGGQNYVKRAKSHLNVKESGKIQPHCYGKGKYLVFENDFKNVLMNRDSDTLKWISHDEIISLNCNAEERAVLLSNGCEEWKFAVGIGSTKGTAADVETSLAGKLIPFRTTLFTLSRAESAVTSQALALLKWNEEFNFCSQCGQKLLHVPTKTHKKCVSCNKFHYPVVNPVGITLVHTHDNSKVLLVRQHAHPPGMYTCIAGFVETGETIEENVRREIAEEVGIAVRDIKYFGSQHWATPINSLMIGCTAAAGDEMLSVDYEELEDAKWFTEDEVRTALHNVTNRRKEVLHKSRGLWIPPPGALAHFLVTHWLLMHEK